MIQNMDGQLFTRFLPKKRGDRSSSKRGISLLALVPRYPLDSGTTIFGLEVFEILLNARGIAVEDLYESMGTL
jgi:hypothetical protein